MSEAERGPTLEPDDKLVVWFPTDEESISRLMASFLISENDVATNRTLYFVDAMDRFPITEFCKIVPPQDNAAIYEKVRIVAALDMEELTAEIIKVAQFTQIAQSACLRDPAAGQPQVYVVLRGLDVIFRNTALKDQSRAHLLLKDILLRLRMIANTDNCLVKTIAIFNAHQRPAGLVLSSNTTVPSTGNDSSSTPPMKKLRLDYRAGSINNANSIPAYITKFYADRMI